MNAERVVLGLDIGVGSVGWGLVRLKEEKYPDEKPDGTIVDKYRIVDGKIIDCGVRTFQPPHDKDNKSLAKHRGGARRCRRTIRRKAKRLKELITLAKEFNLIGDNFNRDEFFKPKHIKKEIHKFKNEKRDIWRIRAEALGRKLTDEEFFRILYHIAKHRGFFFHTTAEELQEEEKKSEAGEVKKGLAKIKKKLEQGGWKTVGQMFYEEFRQTNKDNKRKRNTKDKYEHSIHRSLLGEEIEKIFEEQQKFGNKKADKEFESRYINEVLMKEEGIDDDRLIRMMGKCKLTNQICAPKESYTAERFALFNRLNTLELNDTKNKDKRLPLDDEQRDKIERLAYKNSKVTFSQIRKELGLENDLDKQFNLCSYKENDPEYVTKLTCDIKDSKLQLDDKHKINAVDIRTGEVRDVSNEIKKLFEKKQTAYPNSKKLYAYYSEIRKEINLSENIRFECFMNGQKKKNIYTKSEEELGSKAEYIRQFEDKDAKGDVFVELSGYHKIRRAIEKYCGDGKWDGLSKDAEKLDIIAEALTYHKSDDTRKQHLKSNGITDKDIVNAVLTINMAKVDNHSKEAMRNLLKYMEGSEYLLYNEAKIKCGYDGEEYDKQEILQPYSGFFENNPVVARVFSQTRKLVNAIIRKYGNKQPIDQIHIEVATELANSERRKIEISQGQRRYKEEKELAAKRCREKGLDPEEGQNLLMFRLAEQQNYFCPYSGAKIALSPTGAANEVYIKDCEIDHIIPMSRSFNDSMNNKVLCTQQSNQNKRDRIPFEWFEENYGKDSDEWRVFESKVKKMYRIPYPKKRNLIRKSWTEKDKEKFLSRDLNDTRYAAREVANYLRRHFDFSKSERDDINELSRVQLRSGGITAFLRYMWGLNKDRDLNDLHHAIDALTVACSTYGHVYLVSNLAKEIERKGKNWYKHFGRDKFKPWDNIREDIQDAVDKIFVSRMPRHTVTGAAHKDTVEKISNDKKINKRVMNINGGYAEMGEMVRADIYTDKNGKNYVVPIYSTDIFSKKPLPDKYIHKNDAPYEQWPSAKDKGLKFRFSLFKDDLISLDGEKYYIAHVRGTRSKIVVKNIDGSSFENGTDKNEQAYRNSELKKYSVDILGNYKEVKQEKRLGSRYERRV